MDYRQLAKATALGLPILLSEGTRSNGGGLLPAEDAALASTANGTTPRLSRTRQVSAVFSGLAEGWSTKADLIESRGGVSDRATKALLEMLKPGLRLLDLGAGDGKVANVVLGVQPDTDLTLVDHAPGMVRALRQRFGPCPNVRVLEADLSTIDRELAAERFDLVAFFQVLHHLSRPKAALRAAAALLSDNGRIVTLTVGSGHHEAIFPTTRWDGLGRRRTSAWAALTEEAGLDIDALYRDESWFAFRDGDAYAQFVHRIGSLEKLGSYESLRGSELDAALGETATRAATARCVITIVARRRSSSL
ncbi:class I SAM-dependent methyltransferase [Sphingosinicella sp.]|uniref:class I SAM-dependent methyltransferase n=1 Tax=Sphingosinicella sp. TaxID=1917971 RepID=UPI00403814ED